MIPLMAGRRKYSQLGDAVPQTPWGLTLSGIPDGQEKVGAGQNALPIRIFTCFGARVAPQRCPILRAGRKIITEWEKTVNKIYRPIQKNSTLFWMIFCLDNGVHHTHQGCCHALPSSGVGA